MLYFRDILIGGHLFLRLLVYALMIYKCSLNISLTNILNVINVKTLSREKSTNRPHARI